MIFTNGPHQLNTARAPDGMVTPLVSEEFDFIGNLRELYETNTKLRRVEAKTGIRIISQFR